MNDVSQNYTAHIVVFAYKRPNHLKMTLERLSESEGAYFSSVTIFIDGPKNDTEKEIINEVYNIANKNYGFASKEVKLAKSNRGLAKSIVGGVSEILKLNEHIIVLEDDLLVGKGFLRFMNDALSQYRNSDNVFSINGYIPSEVGTELEKLKDGESVCFAPRPGSWGWATWRRAWQDAEWYESCKNIDISNTVWPLNICGNDLLNMYKLKREGIIDSWAVMWAIHHYIKGGLSLYPSKSFIENIGMDGSGTHCSATHRFTTDSIGINRSIDWPSQLSAEPEILKSFRKVYDRKLGSYIKWPVLRLLNWFGVRK